MKKILSLSILALALSANVNAMAATEGGFTYIGVSPICSKPANASVEIHTWNFFTNERFCHYWSGAPIKNKAAMLTVRSPDGLPSIAAKISIPDRTKPFTYSLRYCYGDYRPCPTTPVDTANFVSSPRPSWEGSVDTDRSNLSSIRRATLTIVGR